MLLCYMYTTTQIVNECFSLLFVQSHRYIFLKYSNNYFMTIHSRLLLCNYGFAVSFLVRMFTEYVYVVLCIF